MLLPSSETQDNWLGQRDIFGACEKYFLDNSVGRNSNTFGTGLS